MPKPRKPLETDHPFGIKLNQIMEIKGMAGQYQALADAFGVTVQSARQWVQYGRFSKEHYAKLVQWSGRDLHWWFNVPAKLNSDDPEESVTPAPQLQCQTRADDKSHDTAESATLISAPMVPAWPFRGISSADYALLDDYERGQVEGLVRALLLQSRANRQNAAA